MYYSLSVDLIKLNPAQEERGSVVVLVQEDHLHQSSKVGTKLGVNSAQRESLIR